MCQTKKNNLFQNVAYSRDNAFHIFNQKNRKLTVNATLLMNNGTNVTLNIGI